jgi:hypothetical protein
MGSNGWCRLHGNYHRLGEKLERSTPGSQCKQKDKGSGKHGKACCFCNIFYCILCNSINLLKM